MRQSNEVFDVYGKYYNLIYQNKNYKNEVNKLCKRLSIYIFLIKHCSSLRSVRNVR